jgi:mannose/fructose/N-acetylgalactosamine-specific phosphotransferase system component IID
MVMDQVVPLLVALALVFVAWKVLKGIVKTVALVVILAAAAWFVFGSGMI